MQKSFLMKWTFVLGILIVLLAAVSSAGAAPACITGSLTSDGATATGVVANTCADAYDVSIISYAQFMDPDGGFYTDVYDGPHTVTVAAGETATLTVALADCTTKVILYIGDNPLDPANVLVRQTYNSSKEYCTPVEPPTSPGTGTPGYWKNHPQAWPVEQITIGGIVYSKDEAISLMNTPERGDKSYTMFRGSVSAKLNVLIGNDSSCVASAINAADAWMGSYPVGSHVRGNSSAWAVGEPIYWTLDDYNNGLLCAPHRD